MALGDFVAFSYAPTDNLNEINKTPEESIIELNQIFEIIPNKKIGFFEISWSTSNFVNGDYISQQDFIEKERQERLKNLSNVKDQTHFVRSISKEPGYISGLFIPKEYEGQYYDYSEKKWKENRIRFERN